MQAATLKLTHDDILTALRALLMLDGFPFSLTEKPTFTLEEKESFKLLDEKLLGIKQDFIAKRSVLPESEKASCAVEGTFSEEETKMMLTIFGAVAKEFPPGNDMDLRMHVPSREAFDLLHERLRQFDESR